MLTTKNNSVILAGAVVILAMSVAPAAWCQNESGFPGPRRPRQTMTAVSTTSSPNLAAADTYKFTTIGVAGSANAHAYSINNARLVTGFYDDASSTFHGFTWQNGIFQTVDYPGATYTSLWQVNHRGVAIAFYGDGTKEHTALYSVGNGTWTALPDIPGYSQNEGYGINDFGFAVGNAYQGNRSVAWMWNPATRSYSALIAPAAAQDSTYTSALNDKGQVVGYFADTGGVYHGFLEQGGTFTTIDMPAATNTIPNGINNNGTIVGGWDDLAGAEQGFILTSGGLFTALDYPGPDITRLEGINDRGDLSGAHVQNPKGANKAFVAFQR